MIFASPSTVNTNKHQIVKKQHYVPQFALRYFSATPNVKKNHQHRIWVFDKVQMRSRCDKIEEVAQQQYFYDLPIQGFEPARRQMVERYLSNLEIQLKPTFDHFLTHVEESGLTVADKNKLALFVALQHARTRKARDHNHESANLYLRMALVEALRDKFPPAVVNMVIAKNSFTNEQAITEQLSMLMDPHFIVGLAGVFFHHIWLVVVNESEQPFYTSDSPIVMNNQEEANGIRHLGPTARGIEIIVPLSPKYALVLVDREENPALEEVEGKGVWDCSAELAHILNSLQVRCSRRQVYCNEDKFDLARHICEHNPALCDPDRPGSQKVDADQDGVFGVVHTW